MEFSRGSSDGAGREELLNELGLEAEVEDFVAEETNTTLRQKIAIFGGTFIEAVIEEMIAIELGAFYSPVVILLN